MTAPCEFCDKIKKGELPIVESAQAVVEHFMSDDQIPFDFQPTNIFTKIDRALTKGKVIASREKFCKHHWQDISSAIVIVMAIILLTFVIQLLTGTIRIYSKTVENSYTKSTD